MLRLSLRAFSKARLIVTSSVLVAFICSCSNLPEYARPKSASIDPKEMEGRDRIAYRTLTKEDFLAKSPPEEMRSYAERMGAVTCAHLVSYPDPQYIIRQTEEGFDGSYQNLDFIALMDRDCSWWNAKLGDVPPEYVLQHEQIHFALAESAARRLDARAQKLLKELHPRGDSKEEVEKVLTETVQELLDDAVVGLLKVNQNFDEDTSNTYAPDKQKKWYDKVMRELGE